MTLKEKILNKYYPRVSESFIDHLISQLNSVIIPKELNNNKNNFIRFLYIKSQIYSMNIDDSILSDIISIYYTHYQNIL